MSHETELERLFQENRDTIAEKQLEKLLGDKLRERHLTLATAESCTGGLVGNRLTNVPGSSDYYMGGIISYDNRIKHGVLGVPTEILETVGAVSRECALAMAEGTRRVLETDLGISTTGIAGPGGGTPDKPVGLVYVALADGKGFNRCERYVWTADRVGNKELSAEAALRLLQDYLDTH
ncbi:MAG TPA: CinA family protein [Chloroflexia bacterium]|nr:CinA family protein [Chloroflexia bacterium]